VAARHQPQRAGLELVLLVADLFLAGGDAVVQRHHLNEPEGHGAP